MKSILAVLSAAILASSPASAAVVSYSMAFKDNMGAIVGAGSFSFDPAVKMDILADEQSGRSCDLVPLGNCIVFATWTPLATFLATVAGQTFSGPQLNAVEGSYGFDRDGVLVLSPGTWLIGDGDIPSLFIDFGDLSDQTAVRTFFATTLDPNDPSEIFGTVDFTRLTPIPLPGALALFGSGLVALGATRRRRRGPGGT